MKFEVWVRSLDLEENTSSRKKYQFHSSIELSIPPGPIPTSLHGDLGLLLASHQDVPCASHHHIHPEAGNLRICSVKKYSKEQFFQCGSKPDLD